MLYSWQPLNGVLAYGEVGEFRDHEDPFHTANSFNFIMMQVKDLQLLQGVHACFIRDLSDVVVGQIQLNDVDTAMDKFKLIAYDVIAR